MFMHDHEKPRAPMYCTLMKEICHQGWTPSMGMNKETGEKPRCHKWVGVFVNDPRSTPPVREVFDCNEQWGTDLKQQIAQEIYQGAAATESVRNHVAEQHGHLSFMRGVFAAVADKMGVPVPTLEEKKPVVSSGKPATLEVLDAKQPPADF